MVRPPRNLSSNFFPLPENGLGSPQMQSAETYAFDVRLQTASSPKPQYDEVSSCALDLPALS
ncbi:MAG: hypothetical protein CSA23_02300 [Deltaproteobacteria bacterium]|nr:MAG: hypothetical protein CSA23_02300 [Deltaproteobacteria bacterium]